MDIEIKCLINARETSIPRSSTIGSDRERRVRDKKIGGHTVVEEANEIDSRRLSARSSRS